MKKFATRILTIFMALSLTTTAFAAEAKYETSTGASGEGTFVEAVDRTSTGGQIWLQEDVNLNGEYVEIDPSGSGEVKIDFCGHELTVAGDGDLYIGGEMFPSKMAPSWLMVKRLLPQSS